MSPQSEKEYYEIDRLWQEDYWTGVEEDRARRTLEHLPVGVGSALDLGCGAGIVTRELTRRIRRVVGLDFARNPLAQIRAQGVQAVQGSATALPFGEKSFDLVVATEVIEHLDREALRLGVREIARVARRYVLVTVPNREVLEWRQVRCAVCGAVFHPNRHTRSFDAKAMVPLFSPAFRLAETWTFGPVQKRIPRTLVKIGHRFGGYAAARSGHVLCPRCGNDTRFSSQRNLMTALFLGIPDRILPLRKSPTVLAALYERSDVPVGTHK